MLNVVEPIQPSFLRQMLIDGIALKERRIQHQNQKIKTLHDSIRILNRAIKEPMRGEFDAAVFGQEKDGGFDSAFGQIQQSFNDHDLCPSIISEDTLASCTLFVTASKPDEMQTVKRLLISVLNRNA